MQIIRSLPAAAPAPGQAATPGDATLHSAPGRPDGPRRVAHALVGFACLLGGLTLAGQHPLAPWPAVALFLAWALACLRWPDAWLFAVPAVLPALSLAPWTGWVALDEFDLALLATLAAGHLRLAWAPLPAGLAGHWRRIDWLCWALWAWMLLGLALAWMDAQAQPVGPPEQAIGFVNSVRVAKSLAFALLAVPLLRAALRRAPASAPRWLAAGVLASLAVAAVGVLWERKAFPGLLNFGSDYRTVGLFWEMHKGGAAIDAFLALAMPFVVWALARARRPLAWLAAALLAQLMAYVCLTTFARGVYGAVLGGLGVLAVLAWRRRAAMPAGPSDVAWRGRAGALLTLVLLSQVVVMVLASSFLKERMDDADRDFGHRWSHWARGVGLLDAPWAWGGGLGLGRLPARNAAAPAPAAEPSREDAEEEDEEDPVPTEFPGAAEWLRDPAAGTAGEAFVRLWGPASDIALGGRYMLTQQVRAVPGARYRVSLQVRSAWPTRSVLLAVQVCERHLLYRAGCQIRNVLQPGRPGPGWRDLAFELRGPPLVGGTALAPRLVTFTLAAVVPGTAVDVRAVQLRAANGPTLLANGDFRDGLDRWYPMVRGYFIPWHIDNLYLETLIERGVVGLVLLGVLLSAALWRVSVGAARLAPTAPYLAAALAGACALGLMSSILDMPRPAFLLLLLAFWCLHLPPAPQRHSSSL